MRILTHLKYTTFYNNAIFIVDYEINIVILNYRYEEK